MIEDTIQKRQGTHGDYGHTAALAQALKDTLRSQPGWARLSAVQRESLDLICVKQARILSGNPHEPDHWHDIAGYAKLAEDALKVPEGLCQAMAKTYKNKKAFSVY